MKSESLTRKRKGKWEYLNDAETRHMIKKLEDCFESKVEISLMKHGNRQKIETLINEVLLLTNYLRGKKIEWTPRIATP